MKNAVMARIDSEVKEFASKSTEAAKISRTIAAFQVGDTVDVHASWKARRNAARCSRAL